MGNALNARGRYGEAEANLREALAIVLASSDEPWRVAWAQSALGQSLAGQRRFKAAESLLIDGYRGISQSNSATSMQKQQALDRVIQLYDAWGKPEKAAEWRKKLADATAKKTP